MLNDKKEYFSQFFFLIFNVEKELYEILFAFEFRLFVTKGNLCSLVSEVICIHFILTQRARVQLGLYVRRRKLLEAGRCM